MDQQPELDQTQKIVRYIIKQTPFGQTKEVIKDLCKIVQSLNPQDQVVLNALQEHNEAHLAVFKSQTDSNVYVISSELNCQGPNLYADQKKQQSVQVDHSTLQIVSESECEIPQNANINTFRDALEVELKAYLQSYYKDQLAGFYVLYLGDESNFNMYIGISAKNINLPNFYCGDWVSKWELQNKLLKGEVKIQAHYYEDGNVQLKNENTFELPTDVDLSKPRESAKAVIDLISGAENNHQNGMNTVYESMPDTFFKAMRRVLPFSGVKFNWNVHLSKVTASLKSQ